MLPDSLNIALKEWAVVQRSLLEGHQIMLLRKGGIIEESGDFDLRAERFLIQPTYIHETERMGDVQPCFGQWLTEEESRKPKDGDVLRFEATCEVADVIRVSHPEALVKLAPQHIWSEQFIQGRFNWEPYKPVSVLLVRAYTLPEPVTLPYLPEYGGCKSWITLREPVPTLGAQPAIQSDADFQRRVDLTRKLLTL